MPGARLPMRKIRDVLRLSAAGMSKRKIAASLGMSATAAGDCIRRARRAGVGWPLPEGLTEEALERRLYPPSTIAAKESRPRPNWAAIHRELRRPGVTLQLLWEEHRAAHPDGYGYSRFCELYRGWEATPVADDAADARRPASGCSSTTPATTFGRHRPDRPAKRCQAQFFVAALGASNYTYAEATLDAGPGRLDRLARARLRLHRRRSRRWSCPTI